MDILDEYGEREPYYSIVNDNCLDELLVEFNKAEFSLSDNRLRLVTGLSRSEFLALNVEPK